MSSALQVPANSLEQPAIRRRDVWGNAVGLKENHQLPDGVIIRAQGGIVGVIDELLERQFKKGPQPGLFLMRALPHFVPRLAHGVLGKFLKIVELVRHDAE